MPNFAVTLKDEISRLARKEVRSGTPTLRKATARQRKDIAAIKREIAQVFKKLKFLMGQQVKASSVQLKDGAQVRFSAKWLAKHRAKLDLTASEYAKLVGVSALSIYGWEKGKSKPRKQHLPALAALRGLGKKEVRLKLETMR